MSVEDVSSKGPPVMRRVCYVASDDYIRHCDRLPRVTGRASMIHSLIEAYNLLKHMSIVAPSRATEKDLRQFHSSEYISFIQSVSSDGSEMVDDKTDEFGLSYDCPVVDDLYNLVCLIAGSSLTAADAIISGAADIAINWFGGWHHAKRDEAAGFCYVNDVVLCILKLREKFSRIVYVDFDLHHGDGVEDAFSATQKVLTVSFHKQGPGFFPGSGLVTDVGIGKGKYYAVNVPLKDGIDDRTYISLFNRVLSEVFVRYRPQAVVCQCGADGISGDPLQSFNLTPEALASCVQYLMSFSLPTVLLGGGGYNFPNTARTWALLTGTVLNVSLSAEIPEHEMPFSTPTTIMGVGPPSPLSLFDQLTSYATGCPGQYGFTLPELPPQYPDNCSDTA